MRPKVSAFARAAFSACPLALAILAAPSVARAQPAAPAASAAAPSPVPSPAAAPSPSPAPSPTPAPPRTFAFSGYGDVGLTLNGSNIPTRFVDGTPSRIFDGATGPYVDANGGRPLGGSNDFTGVPDLQNANLQLLIASGVFGAKFEGSFGTDADVTASNGQSRSGANLTQGYLQYAQGPWTLIAGKFNSLAGAEVLETTGDVNFSRSYLFGEAVPFTHTGVRLTYAPFAKLSLSAGLNNGWDDWKFAGKGKTFEGALTLTPSPGYSLALDTYNGPDFALNGNSALAFAPVYTDRRLYDAVLTVHPTSALSLVVNYDDGMQLGDGSALFPAARWDGIAGYIVYQFDSRYGLALRKETFADPQGFRTSIAQQLQSNTATFDFTPGAHYLFRLEYRVDVSNVPAFAAGPLGSPTVSGRYRQSTFGLESVFKFP